MAAIASKIMIEIGVLGGKASAYEVDLVTKSVTRLEAAELRAGKAGKKSATGFTAFGGSLKSLVGLGALTGVAYGIKDIVHAGTEWQVQQTRLQNALKNTGQYSLENYKHIEDSVNALSLKGGFAPENALGIMAGLVTATNSYKGALQGLTAVTDFSRGTGLSFVRSQLMVQMALQGSTGRLSKYIGNVYAVKTAEDRLTHAQRQNRAVLDNAIQMDRMATARLVIGRLEEKFHGATQKYSNTTSGALSNLKNLFQQISITMGSHLLPALNAIISAVSRFVTKHKTLTEIIIATIAAIGILTVMYKAAKLAQDFWRASVELARTAIGKFGKMIKWARMMVLEFNIAMDLFGGPVLLAIVVGIAAVIAIIVIIATHFKQFKKLMSDVGKAIGAVFMAVIHAITGAAKWIGSHWIQIVTVLEWPFVQLPKFIVKQFDILLAFLTSIPGKIWTLGKKIWAGLKNGLKEMVMWIVHQVVGIPGKIWGGIKSLASTLTFGLLGGGGVVPKHFASGGMVVPGHGTGDTVPAMLTPGEGVLSLNAMKAIGSRQFHIPTVGPQQGNAEMLVGGDIYITTMMDTRKVAEQIHHYKLKIGARR